MRVYQSFGVLLVLAATPASAVVLTLGGIDRGLDQAGTAQGISSAQTGPVLLDDFTGNHTTGVAATGFGFGNTNVLFRHREPLLDTSSYAWLNGATGKGTISFLVPTGQRIDYIGFYLGSVDSYNFISFLDKAGHSLAVNFGISNFGTEINGTQIAVTAGGHAASDLLSSATIPSIYVNFAFASNEQVAKIVFRQTNYATEIDNLTWRYAQAPAILAAHAAMRFAALRASALTVDAPTTSALLALGFAGLIGLRRRCA